MKRIVAAMIAAGVAVCIAHSAVAEEHAGAAPGDKAVIMKKADTNNDGKVTFEELAVVRPEATRETFNRFDRNGDGVLSPQDRGKESGAAKRGTGSEAQKILKADANKDGKVTFEEATAVKPDATREEFDKRDRNKDGVLSREDMAKSGPPAGGSDARAHAARKLMQSDANGDGKVSYEEVTAKKAGFPRESFDRLDRNKDGVLSAEDRGKTEVARAGAEGKRPIMERLKEADTDGDGRVSADEAKIAFPKMPAERFKKMDKNGDGYLSPDDRKQGA